MTFFLCVFCLWLFFFFYKNASHVGLEPLLIQCDLNLNWLLYKDPISELGHIHRHKELGLLHIFYRYEFKPTVLGSMPKSSNFSSQIVREDLAQNTGKNAIKVFPISWIFHAAKWLFIHMFFAKCRHAWLLLSIWKPE